MTCWYGILSCVSVTGLPQSVRTMWVAGRTAVTLTRSTQWFGRCTVWTLQHTPAAVPSPLRSTVWTWLKLVRPEGLWSDFYFIDFWIVNTWFLSLSLQSRLIHLLTSRTLYWTWPRMKQVTPYWCPGSTPSPNMSKSVGLHSSTSSVTDLQLSPITGRYWDTCGGKDDWLKENQRLCYVVGEFICAYSSPYKNKLMKSYSDWSAVSYDETFLSWMGVASFY